VKTCTRCREVKALGEFFANKRSKDGKQSHCKACHKVHQANWRANNRDHIAEYNSSYEQSAKYDPLRREMRAAAKAKWHVENRESKAAYDARYRAENEQRISERKAKWRAENLEYRATYEAEWRKKNPDKVAANGSRRRARNANAECEPYSRSEIFARYGGACAYCDAPAQHLDHVHPISKGGADAPHNLVPACAPCNLSKGAKTLAEWSLTFGA
jgi:5-methylcytosine-specific restriction endonuclease McrA